MNDVALDVRSLPPGPGRIGPLDVMRWAQNPFPLLERYAARFGDAFTLELPGFGSPIVVVSHPDAVKGAFALGPDEGHAGKTNAVLKPLLGRHSLLLLDGAEHLRHRKLLLPAFHGERMHAYGQAMFDLARESIDSWPLGRPFAVQPRMASITLNVIARTVLGAGSGALLSELVEVLSQTLDSGASPLLLFPVLQRDLGSLSPWGRFVRRRDNATRLLHDAIRRAREERLSGRSDVLTMMLEAKDEQGRSLGDDELHDELMSLLVAGYETTATALSWGLRWVLPDRELMSRLREEVSGAGGDPLRIQQLDLLDRTVKETLRLQPLFALLGRELMQETAIGDLTLPAGVIVSPAIHLVHRRPELYPAPERFAPDRYLSFKPKPYELFPFGGGLRRCIGAAFASYEMKMVLAALLSRIDAHLVSERVRVVRRGVTMAPEKGLPIVVDAVHGE